MGLEKMLLISILAIALFSCGKVKGKIEPKYEYVNKELNQPTVIDFYNFKHQIDPDYAFDIKISDIKVIEHKDFFEIQKEKYGIPKKKNGNSIILEFDIVNPYDRSMRIPFPEYFILASDEFEGVKGFSSSRDLDTYINFASILEIKGGFSLNSIGEYDSSTKLIVDFKKNESKSIVLKFTNPFPSTIEKVMVVGFNKEFKILDAGGFDLYSYGLLIDIKNKEILDLISVNR